MRIPLPELAVPRPLVMSLALVALVGGSVALTAAPASAQEATGAIRSVVVSPSDPALGSQLTTDIDWCVADGAAAGDWFSLDLDGHMRRLPSGFDLDDPATGETVATATITSTAPWVITFVVTDYVATHRDVCGTATVRADFDGVSTPAGVTTPFVAVAGDGATFTSDITPTGPVLGPPDAPSKYGSWSRPDQGTVDPTDALTWHVDTPNGPFASATTVDEVPEGQPWRWDCGQLTLQDGSVDAAGDYIASADITPHPPTAAAPTYTCSPTRIEVTWPAQPAAANRYRLVAAVSLPAATADADPATYTNSADVTTIATSGATPLLQEASAAITQASASGQGAGIVPAAGPAPTPAAAVPTAAVAPAAETTPASTTEASGPVGVLAATGSDGLAGLTVGVAFVGLGVLCIATARRRVLRSGR